ncbi:RNase adapter RapZ [Comamonas aquatica]|uniref:RNase adapter RapZ n=1 Tax=Comamonas aquatica TaxID=225991 RepID=UPI00391A8621
MTDLEIVLITGMSGSGKSVALHALEDAGYYCVDNLPPELLADFVRLQHVHHGHRVAIAIDARSAAGLPDLPRELEKLQRLKASGVHLHVLFLDASTSTLVRRFSETRRRHPLSQSKLPDGRQALVQIIEQERELLGDLREYAHVIDTSNIRGSQLQSYVKALIQAPANQMTLVFQSFGFKHGIPVDADYVFDVRMLPNPYYDLELRPLTGMDEPVQRFLRQQPDAAAMQTHIAQFLDHWLPALNANHRSYVTVAIGCTGGQHRSVYLVEQLAQRYQAQWTTLRRHREMESRGPAAAAPLPEAPQLL